MTKRTLPTVVRQAREIGADLCVWDNASRDGTAEYCRAMAQAKPMYFIDSQRNAGKAFATNTILAKIGKGHSHFISIDDDAEPGVGCLQTLSDFADATQDTCGMISPVFAEPDTGMPNDRYAIRVIGDRFRLRIGPPVSGACFVASVPRFMGLGGYPLEDLPVYGREDGWLCGMMAGKTRKDRMDENREILGGYLENCFVWHRPDKNNAYAEFKHRMTFDPAWRKKQEGFFET
jgi:glycosyltransferase involved in cell wall biosynthesis